jgi:hypothetical protein
VEGSFLWGRGSNNVVAVTNICVEESRRPYRALGKARSRRLPRLAGVSRRGSSRCLGVAPQVGCRRSPAGPGRHWRPFHHPAEADSCWFPDDQPNPRFPVDPPVAVPIGLRVVSDRWQVCQRSVGSASVVDAHEDVVEHPSPGRSVVRAEKVEDRPLALVDRTVLWKTVRSGSGLLLLNMLPNRITGRSSSATASGSVSGLRPAVATRRSIRLRCRKIGPDVDVDARLTTIRHLSKTLPVIRRFVAVLPTKTPSSLMLWTSCGERLCRGH